MAPTKTFRNARILAMWKNEWTMEQIAGREGISKQRVEQILRLYGAERRKPGPKPKKAAP